MHRQGLLSAVSQSIKTDSNDSWISFNPQLSFDGMLHCQLAAACGRHAYSNIFIPDGHTIINIACQRYSVYVHIFDDEYASDDIVWHIK